MTILYNLVRVYTNTTGTGIVSLGNAVSGHLTFEESGVQGGDVVSYSIIEGNKVEVGRGTYNSVYKTLSRDEVYSSTNGGAKISLSGNGQVLITALKEDFDHDILPNFEANEHVDHSQIDIIAGTGLLGGGNLLSDITLSINQGYQFRWTADQIFEQSVSMLSGLHVGGESPVDFGNLVVEGDLQVGGATIYSGETHFSELVTTSKGLHIGGTTDPDAPRLQNPDYPQGNLIVEGNTTIKESLFADKSGLFGANLDVLGHISVDKTASFYGNFSAYSSALISGQTNILNGLRVGDTQEVDIGNVTIKNRLGIGVISPAYKFHLLGGTIRVDPNNLEEERFTILDGTDRPIANFAGQAIKMGVADNPYKQVEFRSGAEDSFGENPFISFAIGGQERFRFTNDSSLGINTTPSTKLEIKSSYERDFIKLVLDDIRWHITPLLSGGLEFRSEVPNIAHLTLGLDKILLGNSVELVDNLFISEGLSNSIEFALNGSIKTTQGYLDLKPQEKLYFSPAGKQAVVNEGVRLQSKDYASNVMGWGISYDGIADFREVRANEMKVKTFVSDQEQAVAGSQIISKSVSSLSRVFVAPSPGNNKLLFVRNFEGFPNYRVFADGDYVRIRTMQRRPDDTTFVADCWGTVVKSESTPVEEGEQCYLFYRSALSSEENIQKAGTMPAGTVVDIGALVLDYGKSGSGFIESTAIG
jgi:hypothetical protein